VDKLLASTQDISQMLDATRVNIDQVQPPAGSIEPAFIKLQPVVVWQEFVKELVAIIEMKNMLLPDLQ